VRWASAVNVGGYLFNGPYDSNNNRNHGNASSTQPTAANSPAADIQLVMSERETTDLHSSLLGLLLDRSNNYQTSNGVAASGSGQEDMGELVKLGKVQVKNRTQQNKTP
jgi:hypothetical protein